MEKFFNFIIKLLGLRYEVSEVNNPNDIGDVKYQIYVTNFKKDKKRAFGFWVEDENLNKAYVKALKNVYSKIKWQIKW